MLDIIYNIVCINIKKYWFGMIIDCSNKFKYMYKLIIYL